MRLLIPLILFSVCAGGATASNIDDLRELSRQAEEKVVLAKTAALAELRDSSEFQQLASSTDSAKTELDTARHDGDQSRVLRAGTKWNKLRLAVEAATQSAIIQDKGVRLAEQQSSAAQAALAAGIERQRLIDADADRQNQQRIKARGTIEDPRVWAGFGIAAALLIVLYFALRQPIRYCPHCGQLSRPDIGMPTLRIIGHVILVLISFGVWLAVVLIRSHYTTYRCSLCGMAGMVPLSSPRYQFNAMATASRNAGIEELERDFDERNNQ